MDHAHAPESHLPGDAFPQLRGEPLVPILRPELGLGDPVALATWHEALSDGLAVDLPHDLLALWLFPHEGGVVLLGPEALAQDELSVPLPEPHLQQAQVAVLEEIVRDAGYGSVAAVPVRFGRRDVGLLLMADLRAGRYGEPELVVLRLAAQRLAPSLGRLARQWGSRGLPGFKLERTAALLDAIGQASRSVTSLQEFTATLSRALEPLLPHDRLELLLSDGPGGRSYRLGEHLGGVPWTDGSLVLERASLDLEALGNAEGLILLPDAARHSGWPRGYFTVTEPVGAELRAVVGARTVGPTGLAVYLLAGSVGPDLYDEDDAALMRRVGALIAPHLALLVDRGAAVAPVRLPPDRAPSVPLLEIAERLALEGDPAEATRQVAELAGRILPFDVIRFVLRLSEGDRVVLLDPGERRQLPDLPSVPVAGTGLSQVLQGEIPHLFALADGEARLVVPLRVAGRVHGALVLTAAAPAVLNPRHVEPAQQLADVLAAHLELLRRAAMLPPPVRPGWKRQPRS